MTDYFALFALSRRPWLDLEKLEEKYRELARETHPDQSTQRSSDFAEVNEAYRTLRDPKSRLQHLLTLEGYPQSGSTAEVPTDLMDLFMKIAPALANTNKEQLNLLNKELDGCYDKAIEQLQRIDLVWNQQTSSRMNDAEDLYRRFAFLTRWKNLIEERQFADSVVSR